MKKRVSLLLLALVTSGAIAQDALEIEELPEIRRYTVEVIIFSYAQSVSAGTEVFPPDEPPPEALMSDEELAAAAELALVSEPEVVETPEDVEPEDPRYAIVMLPEEDFQLLNPLEHLTRLDAYEPLMHFGWTQAMLLDTETEAHPLSSFATPPEGLAGELNLYLSRYLHLAVNLQLDAPVNELLETSREPAGFGYRDFEDELIEYPVHYRIDEDRIFRNGDLRYYDHPKFGVLAKITRVEEEEDPEDGDGEALGDLEMLGD